MSPEAAFVTNEGLFHFRVMPFGLCNAPATFERLMDRVLCGMRWSRCLVYLDDVISFGGTVTEALERLEEVLCRLRNFGLQLKAKKCTFMQTEVVFLGHIVGRTGLACDPAKLAAVQNWHAPDKVKGVRQFVGFVGYYRRFVKDFADLAEPLVALTRKGVPFVWTDRQQTAFEALKACLVCAPILGFPTEDGRFVLDTDASLFDVGGVLSQLQKEGEVVIAYASRSLQLSQRQYCTTRREMLAAVVMCTHFRSRCTIHTENRSQFSPLASEIPERRRDAGPLVFVVRAILSYIRISSGITTCKLMSRQCGQCQRPDCPVSATDSPVPDTNLEMEVVDQPFAASEIGKSMDADLLPELSGETLVASALIEEFTADLLPAGSNVDLIAESRHDDTLTTVRGWIQSKSTPAWADCAGLSPELRCWRLQIGNLSIDTEGRFWRRRAPPAEGSQLVVPRNERRAMIRRFHDSLLAAHLGISRTVFRLQTRVYWPGLRNDVRTYIASCTVCITRKSPCPRRAPPWAAAGREWPWTCWICQSRR